MRPFQREHTTKEKLTIWRRRLEAIPQGEQRETLEKHITRIQKRLGVLDFLQEAQHAGNVIGIAFASTGNFTPALVTACTGAYLRMLYDAAETEQRSIAAEARTLQRNYIGNDSYGKT